MEALLIVVAFFAVLAVFLGIICQTPTKKGRAIGAVVAFGWAGLMFMAASWVESLNLNIWYGQAAHDLLENSIEAIEAGNADDVSRELSTMKAELRVTYESRGNFRELAIATTERIQSASQKDNESKQQAE